MKIEELRIGNYVKHNQNTESGIYKMGHKPLVLGECTFVYGKYRAN
jgi:hypothetical protein